MDSEGEPLAGASVWFKDSPKTATATDLNGMFTISAKGKKNPTLVFSFIGMKRAEAKWNGKPMTVYLDDDTNVLGDVVVTGYQVIDKRASTSAITSIKAEDIIRPDAISIDQMLEGQVPDLMFMSNSGEAGVAPKIRIRGTSSIIGNREPLWVVDGIVVNDPVPISAEDLNDPDYVNRIGNAIAGLNPHDIERLDIRKDASATAR
ncbi:MAG: TonB-dependent receptor plug domain-containing protein, partial [Duncaniella sp.]|nr:TonB-dependent receptor plug domain-containing protein [Duncaniella sp.]